MKTWGNIALQAGCHNFRQSLRYRAPGRGWAFAGLFALTGLAGCAEAPEGLVAVESPRWELTVGHASRLTTLARARVSPERPVPPHLVQPLCAEYSLVTIRRPEDWAETHRRLDLPANTAHVDLGEGPIVGILAQVGEQADQKWPLRITSVRTIEGAALLEVTFLPGLYYPVSSAGYLELAQVKQLDRITAVRINSRFFTIHSARPAN